MSRPVKVATARVARASRAHQRNSAPDAEHEVVEARRHLTEVKLADAIARALEAAPPLTPEQRQRLASLLAPLAGAA
jgi:hypothetical protein